MILHYCLLDWFIFISSIISVANSTFDLATPELYILDASGNERRSNDFAVTFNSGISLICRTSSALSVSQPFYWQHSVFGEQKFASVPSSHHLSVDQNRLGGVTLKLSKVDFSMAGIYRCTNGIVSRSVNIHIYGVETALGDSVRLIHKREVVGSFRFQISSIDTSSRPTAACKFRVGRNGIEYTSVRWKGGLYQSNPSLYDVSYEADHDDGSIWSNLTIKHPTVDQGLYGKYYCLFNVITGQMESAEVEISIPPMIGWQHLSVDSYIDSMANFTCPVVAYPPLTSPVVWQRDGLHLIPTAPDGRVNASGEDSHEQVSGDARVRLVSHRLPNDQLTFLAVRSEDRAVYSCYVESELGNATGAFYLRVKNRMAILWPLAGIICELVILFVIILVYECRLRAKRRQQNTETALGAAAELKTSSYEAGVVTNTAGYQTGYLATGAAGDAPGGYQDASIRQRSARF